jgi:hypothetical protein
MIRPFHLRYLPLIYRLGEQGVSLHTELALTSHPHLLRKALISMIGVGKYPTYVWKDADGHAVGIVQLHLEDSSHAHIVHAAIMDGAVSVDRAEALWLPLLEQLTGETGRFGVQSLVAEVNEDSPALPILRRAGFAVYTRQDVWILDQPPHRTLPGYLQRRDPVDDWDIQLLYVNTVPRLVQLVEPTAPEEGSGYVLRDGDELVAFVHVQEGPVGTWLRFFVHPHHQTGSTDLIEAALHSLQPSPENPVYCCVRRYQSWLQSGLEKVGFKHWSSQAVMVKHTVQRTRAVTPDLASLLEAKGVSGSAPVIHRYRHQPCAHVLDHEISS